MKKRFLFAVLFTSFTVYSQDVKPKSIKTDSTERIDRVPIYDGCNENMSNLKLKDCMSRKISKLVFENFDNKLATKLGFPNGIIKIYVNFRVNKEGQVIDIKSNGPHFLLEENLLNF